MSKKAGTGKFEGCGSESLAFHFNADPDPAFQFNAVPDTVPHHSDASLRPLVYIPQSKV